jgi:hypothetical protein
MTVDAGAHAWGEWARGRAGGGRGRDRPSATGSLALRAPRGEEVGEPDQELVVERLAGDE